MISFHPVARRAAFRFATRRLALLIGLLGAAFSNAQTSPIIRSPLGVYVKVDVPIAIGRYQGQASQLHTYLRNLYTTLLADPAISGLTIGDNWGSLQPSAGSSANSFDWSDLDDAFAIATAAHKTVQLIITPGTDMPTWLVNQIPSCDTLFTTHTAPANCGTVTFAGYPEVQRAAQAAFPLPWNATYQNAWSAFLTQLNARYGSNSALVGVAIAGPVGASDEMIFPTSANTSAAQPSGLSVDATWAALIQHSFPSNAAYQNTDQAFIDAWKQAIDTYESIFSGVNLFLGPDAGNDFPNYSQTITPHSDNTLFATDCSAAPKSEIMSCEAKTEILSYFVTKAGPNGKGTQVGGMTASSPLTVGNIGIQGVKLLTALSPAPSPAFVGGAEFDLAVSGADVEAEGCPDPSGNCPGLTPEEAAYNVLTVFFTGTPAGPLYSAALGTATIQYLEVGYLDVEYALANSCAAASSPTLGYVSLQDLYARASRDLFAMANQTTALPASTCSKAAPAPVVSLIANAEGETPLIAPNTWVEIKGAYLSPANDTRSWQGSDFVKGQMPTSLDGVSVTVNGKPAYVYYISPSQIDILTPPDALPSASQVVVNNNGMTVQATAAAAAISPSFFVLGDGRHVLGESLNGVLIGPTSFSTPAYPFQPVQPGDIVVLYANGFGPTSTPVVSGSSNQSGTLAPLPTITIGGVPAAVQFAGLILPGLYQFNVKIAANTPGGDELIVASYGGTSTPPMLITLSGTAPPTSVTFYVSPSGKDSWSGTLAAPNAAGSDGPFATFDHARAAVAALNKSGLLQIHVQFRGGTYYLPATVQMTAADSGAATLAISYENYPGETPIFSGGVRVQNWTSAGANTWKTTLPAATQYFENLFYNGERRLRPRLGGALGTYFRYVGPVYIQSAGPPAAAPNAGCTEYFAGSGWECFDRFQYASGDPISANWKNLAPAAGNGCNQPAGNANLAGDIELVNFEQYSVSKLRVSCVDTTNHIVYLTGNTATEADHLTAHGFIPNHRYLIENVQDSLTVAGQWFLDRSSSPWTLSYLSRAGENPNVDLVTAPQLTQLLVASGLNYVSFRGLAFEHDGFTMAAAGYNGDSPIISAVSFQNSQHITIDAVTIAQTSGTALEFISCIDRSSPKWCVAFNSSGVSANNVVENSAFYDIAAAGIRIGVGGNSTDTSANVPQFHTVQNTVVEGYGRVYPGSKAIDQGQGHDNLYTHNEVYDGYKGAIKICYCANSDVNPPFTNNNVVSFNHVHDLFQGIMNDSGSIYFGVGTPSPPQSGTGNRILSNKVHDVNDASVMDDDGYGGDGLYADDFSGQVDMENNLVYRVSGNAVSFSGPRAGPGQSSTVKNNILAFARQSLLNAYDPYSFGTNPPLPAFFAASNNILYFDRAAADSFFVQGGCTFAGEDFLSYQKWANNLFWRSDGLFASDSKAFHVQQTQGPANICGNKNTWTNYNFGGWQALGEDVQSVIRNPGFNNPAYPADDFSFPQGSPLSGFVVFDATQAGRTNPLLKPPAVAATFPTRLFNPATDF